MAEPGGRPLLLAIGGFEPSGGAGVVRDFVTARALGAAVRLVPTAWTDQSPRGVRAVEPRDPEGLARAIAEEVTACGEGAWPEGHLTVKIGMVPSAQAAEAVERGLRQHRGPVVLDPVLWASNGGALFEGDPSILMGLAARATLVTPNAGEASALAGLPPLRTLDDAASAGQVLCARGAGAILVKGGHIDGPNAIDVLVSGNDIRQFVARRIPGGAVRGTGCALASAIAVALGRGRPLGDAIAEAKGWLAVAIAAAIDVGPERHLG